MVSVLCKVLTVQSVNWQTCVNFLEFKLYIRFYEFKYG